MDPIVYLNEDHNFQIFSYFDMEELAKCCRVSQKWKKFAIQDCLWRRCLPEITVLPKRSKKGGFLQDRFEMLLSKDHPLYPRACVCKMELEVL